MEDKYKELLELHRSKFNLVVDVERLFPILESSDVLSKGDIDEVNKQPNGPSKVDKLLDTLIAKENLAFKSLCYALESTYPHLLTVMFLGNNSRVHGTDTRSLSLTSDSEEDVLNRSQASGVIYEIVSIFSDTRSLSLTSDSEEDVLNRSQTSADSRTQDLKTSYTRVIPSHEYDISDTGSQDKKFHRDHGSDPHHKGTKHKHSLGSYKYGLNIDSRHGDRNHDYDWLKSQCERAMTELQSLKHQQTDNTKRYEAVIKESDSYRQSYKVTLTQLQQAQEEMNMLKLQNSDLLSENKRMDQEIKNLRIFREEDKQELADLRKHQRDMINETGSCEMLTAFDQHDRIKHDYDSLRERYSDLVTQHSAVMSQLEHAKEENQQIKKLYESVCHERDSAVDEKNSLKQQCTEAIRNWDQVLYERKDLIEKSSKITQQRDDVMMDLNKALANHLRSKKELEMVVKERDAALREYSLVMSERDQVHKEIEQLQDKLMNNSKQVETLAKEKKAAQDEAEALKREIKSALQDRDKSVKEKNELNDKLGDSITKQAVIEKQKDDFRKEYEMAIHERDIARRERQEAMQDRERILLEKYERDQAQKEKADKMDQVNKETEQLKKQIEKMQQEIMDGAHEAEIAKNRRDWAFGERDKIVHERDSIRTLCDNLRRDRDRAVSELAQALSDYDEMKKQKYEALKELKELREKYEFINDKEARKSQLNSVGHNHSRDSAIDADLQEWETETVDIEISGINLDNLGFDLVGGKDDPQLPNDNSIFVSHVTKGSAADGKLRVNDQLLRVNNNDVSNVDKKFVISVLRSIRSGIVFLQVIRRRKISPSRSWQAVHLNIPPGKDLGIHLDNGLFISRINPGSYAAKEGLLTVGDRIVTVNGRSIENMSPDDLLKLLYQCGGDTLMLDVWRQNSPLNSAGSSPIPSGTCALPNISDSLDGSAFKHDNRRSMWESVSDSSKGSMKNIKTSGSQTDSLDSPSLSRKHKDRKNSDKDLEHKGRHSVHLLDKAMLKVDKMFSRQRHKSQERVPDHNEDKSAVTLSVRPRTMIETDEDVLGEFDFPLHPKDNSSSANRQTSHISHTSDLDAEISSTGTWPKCVRVTNPTSKGTVVLPQHQKNHQKRPTLDAVINPIPVQKVPPLPPERTESSFCAVRHTPQNSDSTITYNSHPPSPIHSPQPSNSSQYIPKSPIARRSFVQDTHVSNPYNHSNHSQGPNMPHSARVNNTKNPPRMPHIQSTVNTQFQLEPKLADRQIPKNRPYTMYNHRDSRTHSYNSSHAPSSVDYTYGSRSNNVTPEPHLSPPHSTPSQFTNVPPGGRHNPKPSMASSRKPNAFGAAPTPFQPVIAKEYNVLQATTTYMPTTLPENIVDLDRLPPYRPSSSNLSSRSPSQLSSTERFTPIPTEQYPYPSFAGTSPLGPSLLNTDNRIRIPSTTTIQTVDTSGSVEVESDRNSSPVSPFPELSIGKMLPSTSPHAEHNRTCRKRPHPGETRKINIEKTSKPVGFQIEMGPSGGIFVSSVNENSLAAQAGLVIGDQLLEICAINMRNATYDLAARVLQQCGNNLTMLVQYNPQKYNDNSGSSAASSTNTSPINSPDSTLKGKLVMSSLSHRDSHRDSAKSPRVLRHSSSAGKYEVPRKVSFKKPNPNANLGITLAGGNAVGIFVHDVSPESPAAGHNGLHTGDQILEYNGVDFTRATVEQAFRQLKEPCSSVRIKVRYHPSLYSKVRSKKGGDSFYVRAMFDHAAEKEGELGFHKDDILHIEDSMYSGHLGSWYAWVVNDDGQKLKGGTIPSKERLEDDLVLRRSLSENLSLHDSEELKGPTRRGSGSARRSFFRRKRHQRNNSKDSRELGSFSDASLNSDSLPVLDDLSLCTYTSLEKLECKSCRPVVLIAPLADALIHKLHAESPDKYNYCEPSVMQTSHHVMEQGLKDGIYIDYWQKDDHYLCIRVASVSEISNKGIHCLLNVNPRAIERLHRQQIYPIVIYARHKSYKQIKEVRDVQFLPEKMSNKSAKDLFDYCQKAEQDYRHLLSATIQGGNLAEMCQQIKNVIATEQEKPVWVPSCILR